MSKYPYDKGYVTQIVGIIDPTVSLFLILFEATRIKVEASNIPILIHSIRKIKTEVDLYKIVWKGSD